MKNLLHAVLVLCAMALSLQLKDPHLLFLRTYETPLLIALALLGILVALRAVIRSDKQQWGFLISWLLVLSIVTYSEYTFQRQKYFALNADSKAGNEDVQRLRQVGAHLIVGYEHSADIRQLVQQGFVAGLFVTRRNVQGKSFQQIQAELSHLQDLRHQAGLQPLLIATDQEGGVVSRLSPPLPQQPPLASSLPTGIPQAQIIERATAYALAQAKPLAALGINLNFSPVLDLKPAQASSSLDFHTQIVKRAIAADAEIVTQAGLAYSRALLSQGVLPTLKHFPGLGSVSDDTHHFSARLHLPLTTLQQHDWRPFRHLLSQTPALLMVAHVVVDAIDPDLPASLSHKLITDIVRKDWQHDGILITDDMSMGAVYNLGLCPSSIRALNAGIDLLLIAYDWEKVYPVLDCLQAAQQSGQLKTLQSSQARLQQLPWKNAKIGFQKAATQ